MSPFNYCPLVWMFCSKAAHNLINTTHHRALRSRFNSYSSSFDELLVRSKRGTIHSKNLHIMVIEIFKSLNRLNPEFMWNSFELRSDAYNLRPGSRIVIPPARTVSKGY